MASASFAPQSLPGRRVALADIDALVSARLGPTRGLGNSQPACFNRQVAMYLAARVGRWSTTVIGRFYGGRDHSTVCYGIQRVESLSESDPEVDALLADLRQRLSSHADDAGPLRTDEHDFSDMEIERMASAVAEKVCALLTAKLEEGKICPGL